MKLYSINDNYIKYLKQYEAKVPDNKNESRPYLGIVLKIKSNLYFAPLSSPKPKHLKMRENITFMKIKNGKYGVINFNNMIPVLKKDLKLLKPINKSKMELIKNEMIWFNSNKIKIKKKAEQLYVLAFSKKLPKHTFKICNNFKLLEGKCLEWQNLQEKQIIYNPLRGIEFSITNQNILKKQHFSDPRWIAKGEVEKNNIQTKIKEQPTVINIFFQKEKKLIEKKIEVYNLSQLEISNEIELNFKLPKVKQEKLISKKIDNEIER